MLPSHYGMNPYNIDYSSLRSNMNQYESFNSRLPSRYCLNSFIIDYFSQHFIILLQQESVHISLPSVSVLVSSCQFPHLLVFSVPVLTDVTFPINRM